MLVLPLILVNKLTNCCLTLFSIELKSINSENKLAYKLFNLFSPSGFSTVIWILPRFANNVDKTNGTV